MGYGTRRPRWFWFMILMIGAESCCPSVDRKEPEYYEFGHLYALRLASVTRSSQHEVQTLDPAGFETEGSDAEPCFSDGKLRLCAMYSGYAFIMHIENHTSPSATVPWRDGRYVDESGRTHIIRRHTGDASLPARTDTRPQPDTLIRPRARALYIASLPKKIYKVRHDCLSDYVFNEPLIPGELRGQTKEQIKAHVRQMFDRQIPVQLRLPIVVEGRRYDYALVFTLRPNPNVPPDFPPDAFDGS